MSIDSSKLGQKLDQQLIISNIDALREGAELIRLLKENQYTLGYKPAFASTIGAHFRHVLEHYRCFISQMPTGLFCYDKRERDQLLECDAAYALQTIEDLIAAVQSVGSNAGIENSAEKASVSYFIEDEQTSYPVRTSLNRELLFLQSHTVHHYAIIGAMTRAFGNQPDEDFGVAIATRKHNETCDQSNQLTLASTTAKGATCAR